MTDLFGAAEVYGPDDRERWVHEPPKSRSRTDFERDRARVLHSSALRRLGAKTQVLGPESDDFVRTRLTHSLEVAQIGRSLASNFGCDPDIVETACLCHDLGHPPFGHNGERALAEVGADIGGFEGNAQTLRILTRLEPKRTTRTGRPAGLNLTRATLDAVIKYPWGNNEGPGGTPKFNYYRDDADIFEWIHGEHGHNRCVEAQIMDLADDIAYSVHDVEDAIARGFFDPSCLTDPGERQKVVEDTLAWYGEPSAGELSDALDRLLREEAWPVHFGGNYRDFARMKDLTSDLIGRFVSAVCQATWAQSGHGKLVRYNGNVVVPPETFAEITVLKGIAVAYVMAPREHEPHYVEQRAIIFDLVEALLENPDELEPHLAESWASSDKDARLRLVIDQVASLTDLSARQWHAHLCGMLRH
ncbi:deoxyguanosinetriphosphate triphosphohydrolase [Actinotignum sp. GS-2025b]|uniref:deoxyguanosinetriphosphate triphosphohydrolase n=1 Tax=unclassified Actinotignum TaxID=2632702 RepID=UPI003F4565E9